MRVWRVENQDGSGPYNSGPLSSRLGNAHWDDTHPCPPADGVSVGMYPTLSDPEGWEDVEHRDRVCGMNSPLLLWHWFAGWWADLHAHGFRVREWEVPDQFVSMGRSGQVVFARNKATLVA